MTRQTRNLKSVILACRKVFPAKNRQAGMTYVELIVVLSIFAVMSGVTLFNYTAFEDKVNLQVLTSDIALEIVQAQKDSVYGRIPVQSVSLGWKPSYGVHFDIVDSDIGNKAFKFLPDLF